MTWANCRDTMEAVIEALTPTSADIGNASFVAIDHEQIEDRSADDRAFSIRMAAPPAQVAHALEGTTGYYHTPFIVAVNYAETIDIKEDETRIAEDCATIESALLDLSNHHANVYGPLAVGDTWFDMEIIEDPAGGYLVTISGLIAHT